MNNAQKVLLAHPGTQHSMHVAYALDQANLLSVFWTSLFFPKKCLKVLKTFEGFLGKRNINPFYRRSSEQIPKEKIRIFPLFEMVVLLMQKLKLRSTFNRECAWAREAGFDYFIAKRIQTHPPGGYYGFDNSAELSLRVCKKEGIPTVLDQTSPTQAMWCEIMFQECQRNSDFKETSSYQMIVGNSLKENQEVFLADHVIVASSFMKNSIVRQGVPSEKISVIPYGVNLDLFTPRKYLKKEKFQIIYCGKIGQIKGVNYLLAAIQKLANPTIEVNLIGNIETGTCLRKFEGLFKHTPHVSKEELAVLYRQADLLVFPTLGDGFGMVILEAMASGLPVIATNVSGGPDVITDGEEGFIVPSGDGDEIAKKIQILFQRPDLKTHMSIKARKKAETFKWDLYYKKISKVVYQALSQRL